MNIMRATKKYTKKEYIENIRNNISAILKEQEKRNEKTYETLALLKYAISVAEKNAPNSEEKKPLSFFTNDIV